MLYRVTGKRESKSIRHIIKNTSITNTTSIQAHYFRTCSRTTSNDACAARIRTRLL